MMKTEVQQVLQAMSPRPEIACRRTAVLFRPATQGGRVARSTPIGPKKPSARPSARFSRMPETNLFLMFTQGLNTLGDTLHGQGSVAVIIYGEPRLTHDVDLIRGALKA